MQQMTNHRPLAELDLLDDLREQRAKVRACTRPWRLPRKQKETRKACFFLFQMKFYFSSPRALRSIFCQKPFFFSGCSKEPRMPRTPVM